MKYVKNPVVIEAITFEELVAHGKTAQCLESPPWSFFYKDHLIIYDDDNCFLVPTLEGTMRFNREDMLIVGVNGEIYPCRADIFRQTYAPYATTGLTFGQAIEALKAGKRVARKGWNGKGMFLWLLPAGKVPKTAIYDPALRAVIDAHVEGDHFEALPSIRMWTRNSEGRWGVLTGWLASQTDMISEDWEVVV